MSVSDWKPAWLQNVLNFDIYDIFERIVLGILTVLIAVVVIFSLWNLIGAMFVLIREDSFDPTNYTIFQSVFGMIFTVIIAMEFKRSIAVGTERRFGIVQVRAVLLIAMLAIIRKLIIIDTNATDPLHIFALGAVVLALGVVYWLVRDQDRREREFLLSRE